MNFVDLTRVDECRRQQQGYRNLLHATSFPGQVVEIQETRHQQPAYINLLETLVDRSTSLTDWTGRLDDRLIQQLGRPPSRGTHSSFHLVDGTGAVPETLEPDRGHLERPDLGATLIVLLEQINDPAGLRVIMNGPGIPSIIEISIPGLHESWLDRRQIWNSEFPLGVDIYLVNDCHLIGLPRTIQVAYEARSR